MFFFFKQKTAYDMRISDWSSDVCSSDLAAYQHAADRGGIAHRRRCGAKHSQQSTRQRADILQYGLDDPDPSRTAFVRARDRVDGSDRAPLRSEEHTSELQSLIRISYAVFCLKKKK